MNPIGTRGNLRFLAPSLALCLSAVRAKASQVSVRYFLASQRTVSNRTLVCASVAISFTVSDQQLAVRTTHREGLAGTLQQMCVLGFLRWLNKCCNTCY
uniref:Putative secreted protein n=1 Tax=Anopheles darlingi TaxID=43151 RepID=A0A2M4DCP9_ANODA